MTAAIITRVTTSAKIPKRTGYVTGSSEKPKIAGTGTWLPSTPPVQSAFWNTTALTATAAPSVTTARLMPRTRTAGRPSRIADRARRPAPPG